MGFLHTFSPHLLVRWSWLWAPRDGGALNLSTEKSHPPIRNSCLRPPCERRISSYCAKTINRRGCLPLLSILAQLSMALPAFWIQRQKVGGGSILSPFAPRCPPPHPLLCSPSQRSLQALFSRLPLQLASWGSGWREAWARSIHPTVVIFLISERETAVFELMKLVAETVALRVWLVFFENSNNDNQIQ